MRCSRSRLTATVVAALAALATVSSALSAQSLTAGSLRGSVVTASGEPVGGAQVALEAADGGTIRILETNRNGEFSVVLLAPGTYRLLVEQVGFQPLRRLGVTVRAGQSTAVTITIERRPPPITSVVEAEGPSTSAGIAGGRLVSGSELRAFDSRRDVTDAARGATELVAPTDGREGHAVAGLGQRPGLTRLFVDGVPEPLLRHPGNPGEPATSPLFARDGLDQVQIFQTGTDLEWRGTSGSILSAQSRRGGNRLSFLPWVRGSLAKLGGSSDLNPADSSATSFGGGAVIFGALVPDTAHFVLRGEYHSLETPSAFPWENDEGSYLGGGVSIRETIASIGADSFSTPLGAAVNPVVRTWKGGNVSGLIDWLLSPQHALVARAGFATWKERSPLLGLESGNDAGTALDARDISAAASLTSTGERLSNEFRAGFHASRRDWKGTALPATLLAHEGVRFGGSASIPGLFDQKGVKLSDAVQFGGGRHAVKIGASLDYTNHEQTWAYGTAGVFLFGDLDGFGAGSGTYFRTTGAAGGAKFSFTEIGLFAEDVWTVAPDLQVLFGLRLENLSVPSGKLANNAGWETLSGERTDTRPAGRTGVSPRAAFVWDVQNRGEWIVRGAGGLFHTAIDPTRFAEAVLGGSGLATVRAQGDLGWPVPTGLSTPAARLALFSDDHKAQRTFKGELGLTRAFVSGMTLSVTGGYYHGDYLLRRSDLNRVATAAASTDEGAGRPVYGTLVKQGGLLTAEPGSSRRFDAFDLVSAFVSDGYVDHYEVTAALERRVTRDLSVIGAYTFSRTRDNLVGSLAPDPFDQLSPFPEGLDGADWDEGRSDLDVPHRVAATLEYRSRGASPIVVSARWRWRSGLPFTPGFRPGVDPNADGGGNNDPAFLDSGITGLAEALGSVSCTQSASGVFAERNACREKSVQGLDLGLRIGLPVSIAEGRRLELSVDALNVVSTSTGVIDRALVLVSPGAALPAPVGGEYTLPLVVNPNFGTILSRRGEPRVIRVGLAVEY